MAFARFMSTPAGRVIRVVAGLVLILIGFYVIGDAGGPRPIREEQR